MRRTKLRKVSKKRQVDSIQYFVLRKKYMSRHRYCELCDSTLGLPVAATDLHHKRGRGKYYLDVSTFCALCRPCHTYIHEHPDWARANGWLISKFK